jgi:hypothetical protein
MFERFSKNTIATALIAAAGFVGGGWMIGQGLYNLKAGDRYVTVKGFAEREIEANLAIWPVRFTIAAQTLDELQAQMEQNANKVKSFLVKQGFKPEEMTVNLPTITDTSTWGGDSRPPLRYTAEAAVILRTTQVPLVRQAMQEIGSLIKNGVAVGYTYDTTYDYTKLEEIKPAMIAQATQDARRAAEKFAQDSGSELGSIRNAQQGLFSIEPKDPYAQDIKKVRVVTTVQYYLAD